MAKNLYYSCKPENILKNLSDGGFKIIKADNKLSWKERTPLNMFMLTFNNSEYIDKIYKITHILGCRVEIQPMRGSKLIAQCKKCQAFGHTQKFCSKEPRCVQCAGRHLTSDCKKSKTSKLR
jgi:hypothetical protein